MGIQKIISIFLLSACMLTAGYNSHAAQPDKVNETIMGIVDRYENVEGVDCMKVVKGEGLELIKMMLKKEFGKKFMKGVTSIVIIDYSSASESTCTALRKELEAFSTMLDEFDMGGEEDLSAFQFARCFANDNGSGTLSDFIIGIEDKEDKMIMYMGGEIIAE